MTTTTTMSPPLSFKTTLFQQMLCPFFHTKLLEKEEYQAAYYKTQKAFQCVIQKAQNRELPFLEEPFSPNFSKIQEWITHFQKFSMILIIDTDTTALDSKTLCALLQSSIWIQGSFPRICFLNLLDPEKFWETMSIAHPKTTGIIIFSTSREKEETILYLMRCLEYWKGLLTPEELAYHLLVVNSHESTTLEKIARKFSLSMLRLPRQKTMEPISCFSPTTLLPAMIIGFEAEKFCRGAALVCNQFFSRKMRVPMEFVALLQGLKEKSSLSPYHHIIAHGDLLKALAEWYQKVWSFWMMDKWHDVFMPFVTWEWQASMTIRHKSTASQQPFFTLFFEENMTKERLDPEIWRAIPEVQHLAQRSIERLLHEKFRGFHHALLEKQIPFRILQVPLFNEETLGAIFMEMILEVLLLQHT